jgi:arylsulfatase A-like enzyme
VAWPLPAGAAGQLIILLCLLGESLLAALPFVDSFVSMTGSSGTSYAVGSPLAGQTNAGNFWVSIGSNNQTPIEPVIAAGNLSYPGLPPSAGNSLAFFSTAGKSARLNLHGAVTNGRAFYSFILKITDISAVGTAASDNFFSCFSDDPNAQAALLQRGGAKILTRKSGAGYVLGIGKSTNSTDYVYDTKVYQTNDALFVVASYERTGNGTIACLWVNPSAETFGAAAPPPPTLVCTNGTERDLNNNGVRAFVLACQKPDAPTGLIDELRIGTDWGFVTGAQSHARPNIIFVLYDDLGYGNVGVLYQNSRAAGLPKHTTPQMDAFAAEGMQLRHHYCSAPVCAPARSSLLLGVHQGHANVRDRQWDKELANNHTLASVLKMAGYATAAIGKWGLQGSGSDPTTWPGYPTKRGFGYFLGYVRHGDGHEHYPKEGVYRGTKQVWDGLNNITPSLDKCYTADLFTARAKKWIVDHLASSTDQPFFLYLAYDTPHSVYELPTQAYPAGGGISGGLQWLGTSGKMINTATGTVDSYVHPDYANATYDHDNNPATADVAWPEVLKRFATSVRRLDDALADLITLLQDLNLDTNTLVVVTSDNGPTNEDALGLPTMYKANYFDGFGPFDGIKFDVLEGGIRVPTFVRWPGTIPAGTTSYVPSQFHDWMPTFAVLAGLPVPALSDGVSLVPTLLGTGGQQPSTVYVEFWATNFTPNFAEFEPARQGQARGQMQSIRLNGYQGVRYNISSHTNEFEIYDVVNDPKQTVNLAANPAFAVLQQQMKDRVLQLRRPDPDAPRPYDNDLVPPVVISSIAAGVEWRAYAQAFPWVPQFTGLAATDSGVTNRPTLNVRPRDNDIGLLFKGYLSVPADGNYTFYLSADTGALLRIHDATVIDADFGYAGGTEVSGLIKLKAGLHPFRLHYARGTKGTPALNLSWSGPGVAKQSIPDSAFSHALAMPPTLSIFHDGSNPVLSWTGDFVLQSAPEATGPYSDLPSAPSPHTVNVGSASQLFFRLRSQPPED